MIQLAIGKTDTVKSWPAGLPFSKSFLVISITPLVLHGCLVLVAQSCLTLCDPMDCSLPGFSVHGILQARMLQGVAISFSKGSSFCRDWTCASCICRQILYHWATRKALIGEYSVLILTTLLTLKVEKFHIKFQSSVLLSSWEEMATFNLCSYWHSHCPVCSAQAFLFFYLHLICDVSSGGIKLRSDM